MELGSLESLLTDSLLDKRLAETGSFLAGWTFLSGGGFTTGLALGGARLSDW